MGADGHDHFRNSRKATDFRTESKPSEPDALITYRFVKNYVEQIADPKNPNKTKDARRQDVSIFTMPEWKDGSFATEAGPDQRGV